MRLKQSVCYPILQLRDMPLAELFKAAADIGFQAVELWARGDDFADVAALARANNLVVASMIGHGSPAGGLNDPDAHAQIEAELRESIEIAAAHGVPGIICFSGNRREGVSDAEASEISARGLARVAPYAEEKGVNLNLELLNSKVDHPGYNCDRTAWGVEVVKRVGSPRVKLLYDIYHMQIMEGDIIRTIRENIQFIGHFHTAGNPGRNDLDDTQELNYRGICKAIAATGYEFYVGHEFSPKAELIQALRDAFSICDQPG